MDFFWNFFDSISKSALFLVVKDFAPIDWIALFFILFGMLQGSRKGFSDMFGKTLEMVIIILLTFSLYPLLSQSLSQSIPALTRDMADPLVYFPVGMVSWLSVGWCFNVIGRVLKIEVSSFLKFLGGVLFGGVYCALLLSFLVQIVLFIPKDNVQKPFTRHGSYTGYYLGKLAPWIHEWTVNPFGNNKPAKKPASPAA